VKGEEKKLLENSASRKPPPRQEGGSQCWRAHRGASRIPPQVLFRDSGNLLLSPFSGQPTDEKTGHSLKRGCFITATKPTPHHSPWPYSKTTKVSVQSSGGGASTTLGPTNDFMTNIPRKVAPFLHLNVCRGGNLIQL
jgi:hypothetical protein